MKEINITNQQQNQRLDKFLLKYFNKASKGFVYKMLRKKRIKYNGKKAEGSEILKEGDCLQFYISEETMEGFMEEKSLHKAQRHFAIVYEDCDLLVVSKPAGLLVHPQRAGEKETLIDQILYYLYEKGEYIPSKENTFTPAICNRLDRNTSGIVIAGKNLKTVQAVNEAIAKGKIKKYYMVLVKGIVSKQSEMVSYLQKDAVRNQVALYQKEAEGRKKIVTKYRPIAQAEGMTLLEVELITGRSHQIRGQMQAMGHPVAGDRKYGDSQWNKLFAEKFGLSAQFLHAYGVLWQQTKKDGTVFTQKQWMAPLPKQLQAIYDFYFKQSNMQHFSVKTK